MKSSNKLIKIGVELSRWIVAITFIFSGFVKLVDPRGFEYKLEDYLISFGMPDLFFLALPFAVALSTIELTLGIFLLLGIYRKWTSRLVLTFMMVMTPLTLWVALKNPVKDCGCFGDAIVISNWATFYKNIVLSICAILLLLYPNRLRQFFKSKRITNIAAVYTIIFGLFFGIYNIINDPVIDFRPYKIGSNIPKKMHIDPSKSDVFENIFIYKKNGKEQVFTERNYPWNDSTWEFVDMKSKLVKRGAQPEIEDFSIIQLQYDRDKQSFSDKTDITDSVLHSNRYQFLIISYDINKLDNGSLKRLKAVKKYADTNGYALYLLTASSSEEIKNWEKRARSGFIFCHSDERMLKTFMRSNPGLVLMKNGIIYNKWDSNSIPNVKQLDIPLEQSKLSKIDNLKKKNIQTVVIFAILLLAPFGILKKIE